MLVLNLLDGDEVVTRDAGAVVGAGRSPVRTEK